MGDFVRNHVISQKLCMIRWSSVCVYFKDVSVKSGIKEFIFLLVGERQKCLLTLWQVDDISGLRHVVCNVLGSLDTSQLNQTFARLGESTGYQLPSVKFCHHLLQHLICD